VHYTVECMIEELKSCCTARCNSASIPSLCVSKAFLQVQEKVHEPQSQSLLKFCLCKDEQKPPSHLFLQQHYHSREELYNRRCKDKQKPQCSQHVLLEKERRPPGASLYATHCSVHATQELPTERLPTYADIYDLHLPTA